MAASDEPASAVGVDLGGTRLRAGIVELATGSVTREAESLLPRAFAERTPERIAAEVARLVARLAPPDAIPVGIGVAAMLDRQGVVVNAPAFPGAFRKVPLGALLGRALGRSAAVENDVNAIALAEWRYGAGRGEDDLLCVFIGTGIGAGIIAGGRLLRGANGLAGEIGHQPRAPLEDGAPLCGCGQRGCLEAYAGGTALARRALELRADLALLVPPVATLEETELHAGHLDAAAQAGSERARRALEEAADRLAIALVAAAALLDPGRIVLGGGVWHGAAVLRDATFAAYGRRIAGREHGRPPLVSSSLGPRAGIWGAALLTLASRAAV